MLKDLRINDLWVGVESGNDAVIGHLNKGYTLGDAYKQLDRLNQSGIRHNGIFMLGAAGKGNGIENAIDTAKLINKTKPSLVGFITLGIFEGSRLSKEVEQNLFEPATELEILGEEIKLIELIQLEDLPFYGSHPINSVNIDGILPRDRGDMIEALNHVIETADDGSLNISSNRSTL